ncbi:MAG: hypothetical protein AAFR64_11980 [Pseudomonadota bacterium]
MTSLAELETNPCWMPNQIDPQNDRVQFVRFGREELEGRVFLALQKGLEEQWVPIDSVKAMNPTAGPVQFIFHSGFCRSTLLLKALTVPGKTYALNEPEILNSLARLSRPDEALIGVIVDLLSRQNGSSETVLIKPSNFPNRLLEVFLRSRSGARAILITNDLRDYLEAIVRKGLLGRQWGRSAYLTAAAYAGDASAFDKVVPAMTDLQVSALGWLFMQNWFETVSSGKERERIRVLHSKRLNERRAETLNSASKFLGLGIDPIDIREIVEGEVFSKDAKTGVAYAEKEARDTENSKSPVVESEMAEVEQWIAQLARVSGIAAPIGQTLK